MVNKDKILRSLKKYFKTTGEITIDDEGLVSCKGNVELKRKPKHEKLPVAFDRVDGSFVCTNNQLTTLEGAPKSVTGHFFCWNNQLTTLEHSPQSVGGSFDCHLNQLTTLEGAPQSVGGSFSCGSNQLTTLEHSPQSVVGSFSCGSNQLTTLEGAPKSVGGDFWCSDNPLKSLEGLPAILGTLYLSYSPTLPLLRCLAAQKGVEFWKDGYRFRRSDAVKAEDIINRYAGQGRRAMFDCQKALEDAGFLENARW